MVMRWDDISSSCQAIFEWKCMFFQLFPKVKLVDEMMQSNCLCVILHVKRKKLLIHTVFTWFLILDKIQDGGQDGDHVWWRHRPSAEPPPTNKFNIPHLVEKIKGFPPKANCFEIMQHIKFQGGSINLPSPLYHGGGVTECTSEG